MKIAYCFSGHLRRFWDNVTLQEHILARAPGHMFLHTWDTLNYPGATWHGDTGLSSVPVGDELLEALARQYGTFASLVVEHPPTFPAPLMPVIQARYSSWRANGLKVRRELECGDRYDVVLNLRFDLVVHDPFDFPVIDPGILHCVANRNCVTQGLCSDILNFGPSRTMDTVSELYAAMCDGQVTSIDPNSGERYLTAWCTQQNIPFRYEAVRFSIQRSDGSLLSGQ